MFPGWLQILLVVLLAVLLFGGRGKISELMGDVAKGIRSFRDGLKNDDEDGDASTPHEIDADGTSESEAHRDETRTS